MTFRPATCLLSVFPTFAVGGAQIRFAALANRFGGRYRHLILPMDGNDAARARLDPGLDITYPTVQHRKGATLANVRQFRRALREWRPDALVTSNWGSIEWAMANLPPLCRHIHIEDGFGPEERASQLPRRVLTRRLVLRWSTVVVPSRTLARIATETWRLPARRVRYIPNGIDLARFAPAPGQSFRRAVPVIGTVAALRPEKNLARLLHGFAAIAQAMPAELAIVGDGPERPGLERLSGELGLSGRVRFLGHAADPAPLYAGFDLFALSSDTEQMPLSVIEAMAAGLPIASTDVGDVRGMLAAENEPFVVSREASALAASMRALLDDPELRARIGAANRAKAERDFDQEAMFRAYAALFDGTAGS